MFQQCGLFFSPSNVQVLGGKKKHLNKLKADSKFSVKHMWSCLFCSNTFQAFTFTVDYTEGLCYSGRQNLKCPSKGVKIKYSRNFITVTEK